MLQVPESLFPFHVDRVIVLVVLTGLVDQLVDAAILERNLGQTHQLVLGLKAMAPKLLLRPAPPSAFSSFSRSYLETFLVVVEQVGAVVVANLASASQVS